MAGHFILIEEKSYLSGAKIEKKGISATERSTTHIMALYLYIWMDGSLISSQ
jgi:hypothetical protein